MSENEKYKRIDSSSNSHFRNSHGIDDDDDNGGCIISTTPDQQTNESSNIYNPIISPNSSYDPNKFPSSFKYILGNEICERFSFYGIKAILISYLTLFMNYSGNTATSILHTFNFVAYLFPVLGAYIADAKIGRYKTILSFSIIYVFGSITLAVTSIEGVTGKEGDRSPWGMIIGLGLIAMGTGAIKSNVSTFAADQLKSNQNNLLDKLFQIFYWCINLGSLASTIAIPLLRTYVGYWLAFGVPAFFLTVSTIIFVIGSKKYVKRPIAESILWTLLKIVGYSLREKFRILKSKLKIKKKGGLMYNNPWESNLESTNWLDLSKVQYDNQLVDSIKAALNVLLMFIPLPFFWACFDQATGSRWILQAKSLNTCLFNHGTSFCVEADQIQALNPIFVMALIPIVEYTIFKPLKYFKITLKPLVKMSIGMWLAAGSFLIAMFLQIAIDKSILDNGEIVTDSSGSEVIKSNLSAWLLLPQYVVITIGEILISVTGLEFAYSNSPKSMKSIIMSGWLFSVSLGNLFVVFVVGGISLKYQWSEYLLFSSAMALSTLIFMVLAWRFKPIDITITQFNDDIGVGGDHNNNIRNSTSLKQSTISAFGSDDDEFHNNNMSVMILTEDNNDYRSIELENHLI